MMNIKTSHIAIFFFFIFLPIAGATGTYFVITKLAGEETRLPSEPLTHFYVKNETDMIAQKPVVYRVVVENREDKKVEYGLQVSLDGKEIHNQKIILEKNDISNETVSVIPNLTGGHQKLEFLLFRGMELYRTYVFQLISPIEYGSVPSTNPSSPLKNKAEYPLVEKEDAQNSNYTVENNGSTIIYKFDSGERLEMAVTNGIVNIGDAVYSTVSDGDNIMFIQEMYVKILPNSLINLYPVILEIHDNKLSINETLNLKNGYSLTLREINSQNINSEILKIDISKNNMIVREIISHGNSPIEYWYQIDDSKKDRILRIIPTSISETDIMFDITQYGSKKRVLIGDNYEEFKIVNITQDSIIMKNTRPLSISTRKDLSLIKGKIKIKV
ncbi:MAG: hypothetical protein OIN86_15645 [Candidatus Methanoperedens sp.]|nr:hypothetical protein [Candidatus Methanoperedens sp.]CAG0956534.1 hypothetical protein METP1_00476 [Methanosarcinales archaeon]